MIPFVAKVSRIRNRKDREYYVHRINLPSEAAEQLKLEGNDYLLLHAQKAEWYHMLNWDDMPKTWARLPEKVKAEIAKSMLPHPPLPIETDWGLSTNKPPTQLNIQGWLDVLNRIFGEMGASVVWSNYLSSFQSYTSTLGIATSGTTTISSTSSATGTTQPSAVSSG